MVFRLLIERIPNTIKNEITPISNVTKNREKNKSMKNILINT